MHLWFGFVILSLHSHLTGYCHCLSPTTLHHTIHALTTHTFILLWGFGFVFQTLSISFLSSLIRSLSLSLLHTQGTFPFHTLFLSFCQMQNYLLDHTLYSHTPFIIIPFLMFKNWTLSLTNNGFCCVVLRWVWSHSATELVACKRFFFVFFIFNPSCVLQFVYWKIMSWILGILYKEKYIFCSSCHLSLNWSFWVCVFIYFHFWH